MKKLLAVLCFVMVAGCNNSSSDGDAGATDTQPLVAKFEVGDKFVMGSDTFTVGETVTFRLTITNTTSTDVTYDYTGVGHDFVVKQGETVIWSKFYGLAFAQLLDNEVLKANEVLTLSGSWDGKKSEDGTLPAPGQYTAEVTMNYAVNGVPVTKPESKVITLQ